MALRKLLTAQFLLLLTTTASLTADWPQWLGAVEGGRVYAFTSDGDFTCFDAASGKVRWKKSVRAQLGGKPGQWAYSESPLLDGNAVIVDPGGTDATRLAVDKWNGKVIWKSAVPGGEDTASRQPSSSTAVGANNTCSSSPMSWLVSMRRPASFLWRSDRPAKAHAKILTRVAEDDLVYSTARSLTSGGLVRLKPAAIAASSPHTSTLSAASPASSAALSKWAAHFTAPQAKA